MISSYGRLRSWLGLTGLLGILCSGGTPAFAEELEELYRSPRMMAMGGTAVALASDEESLWLNPAGLADVSGMRFQLLSADVTVANDVITDYLAGELSLSGDAQDVVSLLMGKRINARVQAAPSLLIQNFGIGVLLDQQIGAAIQNPVMPEMDYLYKSTVAVQAGTGFSLLNRRKRGSRAVLARDLRVGASVKFLQRRGGNINIPTDQIFEIDRAMLLDLPGEWGNWVGFDVGLQGVTPISKTSYLHTGLVYTNLGSPSYDVEGPDPVAGNLAAGAAMRWWFKQVSFSIAAEMRHLLDDADWRKKTHLGLELATPAGLAFWAGLNQTQLTYGATVNLWLVRLSAAAYGVDMGGYAFEETEARWSLRADVRLNF
jgi:hypothetical protein